MCIFFREKTCVKVTLCTCHVRSCVHPGPWPSPETREQHGTGLHCKGCFLFGNHSPAQKKGSKRGGGASNEMRFPGLTTPKNTVFLCVCVCFFLYWAYLSTSWNTAKGKNKIINVKLKKKQSRLRSQTSSTVDMLHLALAEVVYSGMHRMQVKL